jgi:hypothetical protein
MTIRSKMDHCKKIIKEGTCNRSGKYCNTEMCCLYRDCSCSDENWTSTYLVEAAEILLEKLKIEAKTVAVDYRTLPIGQLGKAYDDDPEDFSIGWYGGMNGFGHPTFFFKKKLKAGPWQCKRFEPITSYYEKKKKDPVPVIKNAAAFVDWWRKEKANGVELPPGIELEEQE